MKNRKHYYYLVLLFITITVSFQAKAQISQGGQPYSFSKANLNNSQVPFSVMPAVDVAARMAEDVYNDPQKSIPWRFGENIAVNLNLSNSGTWDIMPNGDKLWRLGINAPGALSINLIFDHYNLPTDAKLFIYSPNKSEVIGGFTNFNNQADEMFATTLMRSDSIILEYFEPVNASFSGEISINNVTHGYRNAFDYAKTFGSSGTCQNNVACPISAGWTNEVNSACMLVSGGNGFCSGSLVNNTSNDGTPYILTANHCNTTSPSTWVFWFNWQSSTCSNPGSSPTYNSISGATLKASNSASDFCLVQMSSTPPAAYNVYYAGWNNNATAATSTTCIHHPAGDIKKFSTAGAATSIASYNAGNGAAECWNVSWTSGCTEGGSSGSPLFDQNHLIVGQLYGGPSACGVSAANMNDYYGKFSISWNTGTTASTRLRDWLDPTNIGATTQTGFNPVSPQAPVADFNANVTTTCTGSVNFTDLSANTPTSWMWYFGDGGTATTQNPTHVYTTNGTFTVSLKSTNAIGNDSIAKVAYITINTPASPTATGGSRCGTGTVNLSATGTGTIQWFGSATGGAQLATGPTYTTSSISATTNYYVQDSILGITHNCAKLDNTGGGVYTSTGDRYLIFDCYTPLTLVSVQVYSNSATALSKTIQLRNSAGTVLQSLVVSIPNGQSTVTLNFSLPVLTGLRLAVTSNTSLFRNNAGLTYPYTTTGYISVTGSNSGTGSYPGFYNWVVAEPACLSPRSIATATVNPSPTAIITPVGSTTICSGNSVVLNANTGTGLTYQWLLNGSNITGATSATYSASLAGNYTLNVTNSCGNITSSPITVTVGSIPTASITPAGLTTICSGNSVTLNANTGTGLTYQWLLNGTNIGGATSASYLANQAGSFTVNVTNSCGNTVSSPIAVTVNSLPTASISTSSPTDYCGGQPISTAINANTGTGLTYQWQLNGGNIGGATNSSYTATSIGNFTVIVTNTCGNTTSNIISVTMNGVAPTATITPVGSTNICSGSNVTLNANTGSGLSYQWQLNGIDINGQTSSAYIASQTGNYTVVVTNGCGNITSAPTTVTVNATLNTTISPAGPTSVCLGSTVTLNAPTGANYIYQWQFNGVDIPGATSPSYTATQSGNYSVNITDGVCSDSSISISVSVNPLPSTPVISANGYTLTSTTGFTYQWYYAILNAPINGANSQTYIPTLSGDYYVIVTDANGCSSLQSNTLNVTITGIDVISENGFNIYPNPTSGLVNINYNSSLNADFTIKIFNIIGMNIFEENYYQVNSLNKTIDLSEFASGMYYINILMKDKSFNTKIIKR